MLHVFRGLIILLFFPILKRMGYGLTWKEGLIMMFGGLRGAMGLALAMLVALESGINPVVKSLVSIHTSGIVIMTLMINGMTTGFLYKKLKVYAENDYVS